MFALPDFSVFLESIDEGVLLLDTRHRVVAVNEAAVQILGRGREDLLQQACASIFRTPNCEKCARAGRCSLIPHVSSAKKARDLLFDRPDGKRRHLRLGLLPVRSSDPALFAAILIGHTNQGRVEDAVNEHLHFGGMIGQSQAMQKLYQQILAAARSDATVLITGESGTGKELIARSLHENSARSTGPYIPVHCAALPEHLLESELFGHARGAFTGASTARSGRFEVAHGGTLLLDEVGEIPMSVQVKLLRVLQEKEIVRLGENGVRPVDVRIVAATNRDLSKMVKRGEFREDLYYRLRVLRIHAPPLRESREDIPLIANKLLDDLANRYRENPRPRLDAEALALLKAYDWPGNIRELASALEFAMVQAESSMIFSEHLPPETRARFAHIASEDKLALISRALAESGGNRAEAARRLGMSRTTLWKHLREITQ